MYKNSQASPGIPEGQQEQKLQPRSLSKSDSNNSEMRDSPVRNEGSSADSDNNHMNPYGLSVRPQVETSFPVQSPKASTNSNSKNKITLKNSISSNGNNSSSLLKSLPPLFLYMETGDFRRAAERAKNHPREVRTWASIKIKSSTAGQLSTKRLALHQACFKVSLSTLNHSILLGERNVSRRSHPVYLPCMLVLQLRMASSNMGSHSTEDPFIDVCKFILLLVQMYPDAAGTRESRHGCLPLHLAAFASCIRSSSPSSSNDDNLLSTPTAAGLSPLSTFSTSSLHNALPSPGASALGSSARLFKPPSISHRSASESTTDTMHTTMTAAMAQEDGGMQATTTAAVPNHKRIRSHLSVSTTNSSSHAMMTGSSVQQIQSVSIGSNVFVSEKREEWAVKVLNALLDAYPRAIRMDSEGGRLPLHTAAAGRATPRVVSTLVTANPSAARHRNKDGYLPLHVVAHWGQSDPLVAVTLLKAYPDATFGRNRWERTPLEEALCMAGENGRPHQAALVQALRKHPSYWTRPEGVMFQSSSPRDGGRNIVDTDETLPSMDDSTLDDDDLFFDK
jgi:hypothetical protein